MKKLPKKYTSSHTFWNTEYKKGGHLALSLTPSEDLEKFTRFLERSYGRKYLNPIASVLDLGCGNGRNLIYLAGSFDMRGVGYDFSQEAINQAKRESAGLPLSYGVQSIADPIPLLDNSQTIVLDMMTSHFLSANERRNLISEIVRVLKPGGWFFFKTFLLDEDAHAKRLLKENPADEAGSYIHPVIGVAEHVFTEEEILDMLAEHFSVHKISKSHRHKAEGHAAKRRSISVYAQKIG
ncbi:MAG: class I SAM-dependent methyltransferase [Candidatus Yonathbacteria bacterium]|nr:class I SAM-dependent methyltransferase [Candidatus Yonathbacteria bacterium]